jgi:adenine-specific DNA-methyltransferase
MAKKTNSKLTVETLTHEEATRKNTPTAEYQSVMWKDDRFNLKNFDLRPKTTQFSA